jgi:hypothetical protein
VLANVVAPARPQAGRELVVVDWTGSGRAPRVWPLAFLLWSVGAGGDLKRVDRVMRGWGGGTRWAQPRALGTEERERLPAIIAARPIALEAWSYATGRRAASGAARRIAEIRRVAATIAAHVAGG